MLMEIGIYHYTTDNLLGLFFSPSNPDLPQIERLRSAAPLYVQIAESLLERIQRGELQAGDRLPSERELSQQLGVSRLTLRRALRTLASQGLLVRTQGRGTYIAEPKIERQAGRLVSFTQGMQAHGLKFGAHVLAFEPQACSASLARALHLPLSAQIYAIVRLRTLNQEPVLLERYALPLARFPGLDQHDLEDRSIYDVLSQNYGVSVSRASQSLEPVVAGEYEAGLLAVEAGAPLMLERRLSFDQHDQPLEAGRDLYRGDRFRFVTESAPFERWEPHISA
jgi:GntR family transcriptional regulator